LDGLKKKITIRDNGATWNKFNNWLTNTKVYSAEISDNGSVFIGTNRGVLYAADLDTIWREANNGLSCATVLSLAKSGNTILAGSENVGVSLTTDKGDSWTAINNGITNKKIYSLAVSSIGDIFAGTDVGVFLSTNNGINWTAVNSDLRHTYTLAVSSTGAILAGTCVGIFQSTDNGTTWVKFQNGLPDTFSIRSIITSGSNILAATDEGVILSTDNGTTWTSHTNTVGSDVKCLALCGNTIFAGTAQRGVFSSSDMGKNWSTVNIDTSGTSSIYSIVVSDSIIFIAAYNRVYLSNNNGLKWDQVNSGLPKTFGSYPAVNSQIISGDYIFAGTSHRGVWRRPIAEMISDVIGDNSELLAAQQINFKIRLLGNSNQNVAITFSLPNSAKVNLKVYNLYGMRIATIINQYLRSGFHELFWNIKNIPAGCYTVKMQSGSHSITKSILITR